MLKVLEIVCIIVVTTSLLGACIIGMIIQYRSYTYNENLKTSLISQTV